MSRRRITFDPVKTHRLPAQQSLRHVLAHLSAASHPLAFNQNAVIPATVERSATKSGDLVGIMCPNPTSSPICASLVGDDIAIVLLFPQKFVIPAAVERSATKSGDLVDIMRP